jgi:hypothetical protein
MLGITSPELVDAEAVEYAITKIEWEAQFR